MISRQNVMDALKIDKIKSPVHILDFQTFVRLGVGVCFIPLDVLTAPMWQRELRKCDRIFIPEDSINEFAVVAAGRGWQTKLARIQLPGLHWRLSK